MESQLEADYAQFRLSIPKISNVCLAVENVWSPTNNLQRPYQRVFALLDSFFYNDAHSNRPSRPLVVLTEREERTMLAGRSTFNDRYLLD